LIQAALYERDLSGSSFFRPPPLSTKKIVLSPAFSLLLLVTRIPRGGEEESRRKSLDRKKVVGGPVRKEARDSRRKKKDKPRERGETRRARKGLRYQKKEYDGHKKEKKRAVKQEKKIKRNRKRKSTRLSPLGKDSPPRPYQSNISANRKKEEKRRGRIPHRNRKATASRTRERETSILGIFAGKEAPPWASAIEKENPALSRGGKKGKEKKESGANRAN